MQNPGHALDSGIRSPPFFLPLREPDWEPGQRSIGWQMRGLLYAVSLTIGNEEVVEMMGKTGLELVASRSHTSPLEETLFGTMGRCPRRQCPEA